MLFWKDIWVGDSPLTVQIPNPFVCARDWLAKASDYMVLEGDQVLWGRFSERICWRPNRKTFSRCYVSLVLSSFFHLARGRM